MRTQGVQGSVTATGVIATLDLQDAQATAAGACAVGAVGGTFVGTAVVEISLDGVTFATYGAALTAPGAVKIDVPCRQARVRCSAYTSGTIVGFVAKFQD